MRPLIVLALGSRLAAHAAAQGEGSLGSAAKTQQQAADLATIQLSDTSFIHRYVALDRLKHAAPAVRRAAATQFTAALRDTARGVRERALAAIWALGPDASGAVPAVLRIVATAQDPLRPNALRAVGGIRTPQAVPAIVAIIQNPRDPQRAVAISVLGGMGASGRPGIAALREAAADSNEAIRMRAALALEALGDSASAIGVFRAMLRSSTESRRFAAARALASLSDPAAIPVLQSFLGDTSFRRRTEAASALGAEGPKAAAAIPALVAMLGDTVHRRIPDGTAWSEDAAAPYAAWALTKIIPFRATGATGYGGEPLRARIDGASNSLRGDGLGPYSWGVDSAAVFKGAGFVIMLASDGQPRGPFGPETRRLRRSLSFDLSKPIPGSRGKSLGLIRDDEAQVHIWYKRDPHTNQILSFQTVDVSDSAHAIERIEMHFRINGTLHELQMGPFVEGQGGGGAWFTGVHGEGTLMGQLLHPASDVWIVRADATSIARLWSFEDRAHPVDRGLYYFSLEIRFMTFPGGPDTACIANPSECWR